MASVKERAAALNLEEKLSVCPSPSTTGYGMSSRTVQLSSIWSSLISHLRSSVNVKRRRVHLKSHGDCFQGSEAVDVVADHIVHAKGLEGADVSREKVVCVCQALLDCKVFEAVVTKVFGKDKKQDLFQDSKSALYRFLSTHTSVAELDRGVLSHGIQKLFCSALTSGQGEPTSTHGAPVQLCTPVKSIQMCSPVKTSQLDPLVKADQPLETLVEHLGLSSSRLQTDCELPQSLVEEVWQEQTMLQLLKVVDLPLLDGVLQCIHNPTSPAPPPRPLAQSNPDLIYSSNHLDRQVLKAFRDAQEDEWLCAALDCLDFLPDQPVVEFSRELPRFFPPDQDSVDRQTVAKDTQGEVWLPRCVSTPDCSHNEQSRCYTGGFAQCKLLLYGTLAKHYSQRPPLLPQHLSDVYTAITDLLVNAKLDKALEALQLCLKLLPSNCREELRRLLTFMALAGDPQEIKLDKDVENRLAVKRSFLRAILHSRTLCKEKEDLMVLFMLGNGEEIFKIQGALHKVVSDKLASLVQGKLPDDTGSTFCRQVSQRSFIVSTQSVTNQELWNMLKNIHQDPKISAKNRKRLLGQFYQAHPEIFHQYFGDSAVSVL